jgi:hypothetical protein
MTSDDKPREAQRLDIQKKIRHGLVHCLVIHGENKADIDALLDFYEAEFKPSTPTEDALITDLVACAWRLRRFNRIETALSEEMLKSGHTLDPFRDPWGLKPHPYEKSLRFVAREKARLERSFNRALKELQSMRTKRTAAPRRKQRAQPAKRVPALSFPSMTNIPTS